MFGKTIFVVAAIAASLRLILGIATVPFSQTAAADKDCSVGRILKESKPDNWVSLYQKRLVLPMGLAMSFLEPTQSVMQTKGS